MAEKPVCFVIAPIGKEGTDTRHRSDRILKYVIKPVATECGYQTIRADHISEPGMITTQVINHIVGDAMVVADLTGSNANVFYELAVRHATRKPYIQIIQKGETIPFDVAGVRTIEVDHTDLESVAVTKDEIKKQMERIAGGSVKIESPISVAIDFDKLHRSEDPEKRQIADIMQGITDIKNLIEKRGKPDRDILHEYMTRRAREERQLSAAGPDSNVVDIMQELRKSLEKATQRAKVKKSESGSPPADEGK